MSMRTFVISDIHGDSKNFHKILADVSFDAAVDRIYINGDVLDRGKHSLKLLYEIKQMAESHPGHVFLTMGNHELFCLQYIRRELADFTWRAFGSTDTVEEVNRLNPSETEALAEYIQSLPLYLTIDGAKEGKDGQLLMTHSGFQADYIVREPDGSINVVKTIESSARSDLFKHLVSNDIHYIPTADRKAFDRTVLVGHVPVMRLNYDGSYKIRRDRNLISIDSGAGHRESGGRLSLYEVETGAEYYR